MGQTQSFHTVAETSFEQMNRKKKTQKLPAKHQYLLWVLQMDACKLCTSLRHQSISL